LPLLKKNKKIYLFIQYIYCIKNINNIIQYRENVFFLVQIFNKIH